MNKNIQEKDIQIVEETSIDLPGIFIETDNALQLKQQVLSNQEKLNKIVSILKNHYVSAQEYAEAPYLAQLESDINNIVKNWN